MAVLVLALGFVATAQAAHLLSTKTARILTAAYGESVEVETANANVTFTDTGVGRCTRQSPRVVTCVLRARAVDVDDGLVLRCTLDVRVRQVPQRITLDTPREPECGVAR